MQARSQRLVGSAAAILIVGMSAAPIRAQTTEPIPEPTPEAATAPPAAPAVDVWVVISRSSQRIYLAEVGRIARDGEMVTLRAARVPATAPPSDYSHTEVNKELRCTAKTSRDVAETEYDASGVAGERVEIGDEFADFSPQSLDAYVAAVACGEAVAIGGNWPSLKAYIDEGRK